MGVTFKLRDHQRTIKQSGARFKVPVLHRRAGKSVLFCALLMNCATAGKAGQQFHYVGPSIKQTKAIAWLYVTQMANVIPGCVLNQSELKVTFANKATLELLGVENIDSLRGRYSNGIVLDEAQLMPSSHWTYVIRPLLADRKGWAVIGGTPAGWHNLLGDSYRKAEDLAGWERFLFKHDATGALPDDEIESMRADMSEQAWKQEMECDFNAAIEGAFYAREIQALSDSGRLTTVRYNDELPVTVSLDLGHSDLMPCLWAQNNGTEVHVIHSECYQFTSIPDMIKHWRDEVKIPIDRVILPHDARVRDLTSGNTREQIFQNMGLQTDIAPKLQLYEGIEQSRNLIKHLWIDKHHALTLYEALASYRSEKDETTGVVRLQPVHDWASHWADAWRYMATGDRFVHSNWGHRDYGGLAI